MMTKLSLLLAALCLAACSSEPAANNVADAAPQPPAPTPAPAAPAIPAAAQLIPVAVEDDIDVPRVAGIDAAAARRINAVLDRERADAINAVEACRRAADGRDVEYELEAMPTYNRDGLLSFRMRGASFCGGANNTTLYAAHIFDTATGAEIDPIAQYKLDPAALATLARPHYSGPAECRALFEDAPDIVDVGAVYLDGAGLGIVYRFDAGAAESCGEHVAVIPAATVRAEMELGGALARAWPDAGRVVTYSCDGGTRRVVRFAHELAWLLLPDGEEAELEQQRTASGIWYRNADYDLRGKGDQAVLTMADGPTLRCTAA